MVQHHKIHLIHREILAAVIQMEEEVTPVPMETEAVFQRIVVVIVEVAMVEAVIPEVEIPAVADGIAVDPAVVEEIHPEIPAVADGIAVDPAVVEEIHPEIPAVADGIAVDPAVVADTQVVAVDIPVAAQAEVEDEDNIMF